MLPALTHHSHMDKNLSSVLLHALAQIRRQQIVEAKLNLHVRDIYPDSYAYAVANSVCPFQHEDAGLLEHHNRLDEQFPFRSTYAVTYEQIVELATLLDTHWRQGTTITFYAVEDHYRSAGRRWTGPSLRMDLIHCCRYMYLCRLFDENFWTQFVSNAPVEANDLNRAFDPEELRPF